MIKFFKLKGTMILFIITTVIFAGLYLFTVINPVSYIGSYSTEVEMFGMSGKMTYKFKSGNKVDCTESGSYGGLSGSETVEQWYFRKGDRVVIMESTKDFTEEMYNEEVESYKEMSDEEFEAISSKITYGEMAYSYFGLEYSFENTLGFLVRGLVMLLAGLSCAGLMVSIMFNVFSKKGKKASKAQAEN